MTDSDVNVILLELSKVRADHDVIVGMSSDVKGMTKQLEKVCAKVDSQEHQLTVLQTEHDTMKSNCNKAGGMSGKEKVTIYGALTFVIGVLLYLAVEFAKVIKG